MVKSSEVVLVHDSGGRELLLKPGLNIIGGVQPRGVSEVIADGMLGILIALDTMEILESPDILGMVMVDAVTFAAFEGDEVEVGVITMSRAIEPTAMPESAERDLVCIPDVLIRGLGLSPRPVPA
jgi:hypothetical protein